MGNRKKAKRQRYELHWNRKHRPAKKSQAPNSRNARFYVGQKKGIENEATAIEKFWRWPKSK